MADIRIKVAKDKAKLVKALRAGEGSTGPFQTYVDLMVFAASLGVKYGKYIPVKEASRKDPDPIPWEHFVSRNQSQILDLLAVTHTKDPRVLGNSEEFEGKRIEIFESYANGGFELIQEIIRGSKDHSKQILLLIAKEKEYFGSKSDLLDLDFL